MMASHVIKAVPLTKENFAAFGDVIETEGAKHFPINGGTVERFHDLANVTVDLDRGGRPLISIMQINTATALPARVNLVERHLHGSQAFIPTFNSPVVVVVAPPGDQVHAAELEAFVTNGKQGYNFHPGVWHMPLMTTEVGQQMIIVDRGGPGANCDEWRFDNHEITVSI